MRPREFGPVRASHAVGGARPASSGQYVVVPDMVAALRTDVDKPVKLPPLPGNRREVTAAVDSSIIAIAPDWSGSIFATWGGDPRDAIGAAGVSLLRLQRRSGHGLAMVQPWGTRPDDDRAVPPCPVRKSYKSLESALRSRVNLGGNDLPAALNRVADRLDGVDPDLTRAVFVPTDGGEPVTTAMHDAVARFPAGSVHLILIDPQKNCSEAMERDWMSVAFGTFARVEDLTVDRLAQQMADIYAAALGITETPPTTT